MADLKKKRLLDINIVLLAAACGAMATILQDQTYHYLLNAFVIGLVALVALKAMFGSAADRKRRVAFAVFPLALFALWMVFKSLFGEFDVSAILFHYRHGFASGGMPADYYERIALILLFAALAGFSWWRLVRANQVFLILDRVAFLPLLIVNPMMLSMADSAGLSFGRSVPLMAHYREVPDLYRLPPAPPNLIHVFLESAELTYADATVFGDVMAPLSAFTARGLNATGIAEVSSTGWTIAGQVASTCGIPLVQPWLQLHNEYPEERSFLPNARCLGDVLAQAGYRTEFFMGAPLSFAGTGRFFSTHGYDRVQGFDELLDAYPDVRNFWGLDDEAVLNAAYLRIEELSGAPVPYAVTIQTIGGHAPDGIVSKSCRGGDIPTADGPDILRGIECTNRLVAQLISRLERRGLLENTIVVLQSDHLVLKASIQEVLDGMERRNFFVAFGPGIEAELIDRPSSMMDVYPTILQMMGFDAPEKGVALGVSLLGNEPNLVEQFGFDVVDNSIRRDKELRHFIWGLENPGS